MVVTVVVIVPVVVVMMAVIMSIVVMPSVLAVLRVSAGGRSGIGMGHYAAAWQHSSV